MKNKFVAVLICVIVVALAIVGGARRTMSRQNREVEQMFVDGVDGDGMSIHSDLLVRAGLAYNLTAVAERYLDADDPLITAVRDNARALERETSPAACYRLNALLDQSVNELDVALQHETLTEADEKYRTGIMTDLQSCAAQISHDGYNAAVRELNEVTLRKFPARYLKYVTFTGEAEYYG